MNAQQWKVILNAHDLEARKHLKLLNEAQTVRSNATYELNESTRRVNHIFSTLVQTLSNSEKEEKLNSSAADLLHMRKHLFSIRELYASANQQRITLLKKLDEAVAVVARISAEYQTLVERNKITERKYRQWLVKQKILEQAFVDEENHEVFALKSSMKGYV